MNTKYSHSNLKMKITPKLIQKKLNIDDMINNLKGNEQNIRQLSNETKNYIITILCDPSNLSESLAKKTVTNDSSITIQDIVNTCRSDGILFSSFESKERATLIEFFVRIFEDVDLNLPVTEHHVVNCILRTFDAPIKRDNYITLPPSTHLDIKTQILDLFKSIKPFNCIHPTKHIAAEIDIFFQSKGKIKYSAEWLNDPKKRAVNIQGICQVNTDRETTKEILRKEMLTHPDKISANSNEIKKIKNEQYNPYYNLWPGDKNIKIKYDSEIKKYEQFRAEHNYYHAETTPFSTNNFNKLLKDQCKLMTNDPFKIFEMSIPRNTKHDGHSISLSIKIKDIASEEFYSIKVYDSNYNGNFKFSPFSYARTLLIPKNILGGIINAPWPLPKEKDNLFAVEEYKNLTTKPTEIKFNDSYISLNEIIKNPFVLRYCSPILQLKYLSYLTTLKPTDIIKILKQIDKNGTNLATYIAYKGNNEVRLKLLDIIQDKEPSMLTITDGVNSLATYIAYIGNNEVRLKLLDIIQDKDPSILTITDEGNSLATYIASSLNNNVLLKLLDIIRDTDTSILRQIDKNGNSLAGFITYYCNDEVRLKLLDIIRDTDPSILRQIDKSGSSLAELIDYYSNDEVRLKLLDIISNNDPSILIQLDKNGYSLASKIACEYNNNVLLKLLDIIENAKLDSILKQKNSNGYSLIQLGNDRFSPKIRLKLVKILGDDYIPTLQEFKKL